MSASGNRILEVKSVAYPQTLSLYQRVINDLLSQNDLDFDRNFSKIKIIAEPDFSSFCYIQEITYCLPKPR